MFEVTTLDIDNPHVEMMGRLTIVRDFFGRRTNLTVSSQLEGELAATALGAIYTFGPTFHCRKLQPPRHLAEFWMIERGSLLRNKSNMDLAESLYQIPSSMGTGQLL